MSVKFEQAKAYDSEVTNACEIAYVKLMRAFAMYKDHLRLIGGLVPRYLTPNSPHVGTTDVDVVLNLDVLVVGAKYDSLKKQLKKSGFERAGTNSWQWECQAGNRRVVVEFLQHTDELKAKGPMVISVDDEEVSACQIPHAGMVHDWYEEQEVRVELEDGTRIEQIRYADIVAFVALKAIAFENRGERKDAADLLHVLVHYQDPDAIAEIFATRIASGDHAAALQAGLTALVKCFCSDKTTPGWKKDGPGSYTAFHDMRGDDAVREQRKMHSLVEHIVRSIGQRTGRDYLDS